MVSVAPFLRWVGGKPWFAEEHAHYLPVVAAGCTYHQPFMGGGSPFFQCYAGHRPAVLSDVNERLVATYTAVRDHVEDLIAELAGHPYEREHYYEVRRRLNTEPDAPLVQRAAWFLAINRHGFNGLWRVNRRGECNVPFGDGGTGFFDVAALRRASAALRGVEIRKATFIDALRTASSGDAVFLDPPYVPVGKTANFVGYSIDGFGPADHAALGEALVWLDARGVRFCLTNADTPETRELYARWHCARVLATRSINSDGRGRGAVPEIVVTNYPVTVPAKAQMELWT